MTTTRIHPPTHDANPAPTEPVRVALASLPTVLRVGLETMLARHAHRVQLLDESDGLPAHVVLFDPVADATMGVGSASAAHARAVRVALAWDDSPRTRRLARTAGAVRVVPVSVSSLDLVRVVEQVHRTTSPSPHSANPTRSDTGTSARANLGLSPREVQILERICLGMSNDEIAAELYLSINSIKTYIRTAYRKIGVSRRAQAVLWGIDHGLGAV